VSLLWLDISLFTTQLLKSGAPLQVVQFFPSVVNTLGFSRNITLLCTAPPYLLWYVPVALSGVHVPAEVALAPGD
jgi:hypothetical protein